MNPIFKKLNYKEQSLVVIINAPESFHKEMQDMNSITKVASTLPRNGSIDFVMAFVTKQQEVDTLTEKIVPLLSADGLLWFVYPKGSSKRYKCDFNRDSGWALLGKHNFEPVRMVAIDEDWSALRFRHVDKIKVMKRSTAISEAGTMRISSPKKTAAKKRRS